ncbi:MAG: hypothetical protein ABI587_06665 [Gemmatimonadales bacterium]
MPHRIQPTLHAGLVVVLLVPAISGAQTPLKPIRHGGFPSIRGVLVYNPNTTACLHVEAFNGRRVGRLTVVNYAQ